MNQNRAPNGLTLDHDTSTLPSGTTVHTWRIPSPRAIIVLQHGFGEYAERYVDGYHNLVRRVNELGFEVRALDMWGHGQSPGVRGVTHVQKAVNDHVKVREEAVKEGLPIFLFGHSLGGLVTAGSVVASPGNIKGVVLTSPALPEPLPSLGQSAIGAAAAWMPTVSIPKPRMPITDLSRLPEQQRIAEVDPWLLKRQVPFLIAATALQTVQTISKGYDKWVVPTLVLHGTADTYCDPKGSAILVNGIASGDKTLRLFEGGFHELLNDVEGDEALKLILEWLVKHLE